MSFPRISLLVQCSSTVFFGVCTQLLSSMQWPCQQRNPSPLDLSRNPQSDSRHSCLYYASTFVRWLPCVVFFAGNLVQALVLPRARTCNTHTLALACTRNHSNAHALTRLLRSHPYKLSSSSTCLPFSFFAPAAASCRQEWTCCVLAPKQITLQWGGLLSSFAGH